MPATSLYHRESVRARTRCEMLLILIVLSLWPPSAHSQSVTPQLDLNVTPSALLRTQLIEVSVKIRGASNMGSFQAELDYDPERLMVSDVTLPASLGVVAGCNPAASRCMVRLGPRMKPGQVSLGAASYGNQAGLSGDATLAVIHLQPTGRSGATTLRLTNIILTDISAAPTRLAGTVTRVVISSSIYIPLIHR